MLDACRELTTAAGTAVRVRYRLSRPGAALRALAAVLDVVVYAGASYFIMAVVFRRTGFARFELILIGFVAFSWTLRSMLEAWNFGELHDRMREYARAPVSAATAACLAPPAVGLLVSLAVAVTIEVAALARLRGFPRRHGLRPSSRSRDSGTRFWSWPWRWRSNGAGSPA